MLSFKGDAGKDLCDSQLGSTRRTFLRVGGAGMLGISLPQLMRLKSAQAAADPAHPTGGGPGWNKAKSIIMVYLQGGPSQLDTFDMKPAAGDEFRGSRQRW